MKERLKELRDAAGLSQAQLAYALKYNSPAIVSMWENGSRKPPSDKLPQLAKVLGCTINDLFNGGEEDEI